MLNSEADPEMTTKANETLHLVEFAVELLTEYRERFIESDDVAYRFLLASAQASMSVNQIIAGSGRNISKEDHAKLFASYL